MATAKQIAWRKKFGAMAKAGAFADSGRKSNPRSEVRSPTSTRTATRTNTSTEADTQGNITVTGGAGRGATSVSIHGKPSGKSTRSRAKTPCARKTNPLPLVFKVQSRSGDGRSWTTILRLTARKPSDESAVEKEAFAAARALHKENPNRAYRVIDSER